MTTCLSEPFSIQSVNVHFDRGFSFRPRAFYERLECREWLTCLDWHYAEAADRLNALEPGDPAIELELSNLELLEDEIREAEALHLRLSLPPLPQVGIR